MPSAPRKPFETFAGVCLIGIGLVGGTIAGIYGGGWVSFLGGIAYALFILRLMMQGTSGNQPDT